MRDRFVRWYFGRVIGRYCPCEWAWLPLVARKPLMNWCGRMDDAYDKLEFKRACGFILAHGPFLTTTSSSATNVDVKWRVK